MRSSSHFRLLSAHMVTAAATALTLVVVAGATAKADDHRNDNKSSVYLDRDLHPTAMNSNCTSPPPQMWAGTGLGATNFVRERNVEDGVELAIRGHKPYAGDLYPATYVDDDGLVHIEVPTGSFPHGSGIRANWSFEYSFDVGLNSANPTLDQYDAELWIDTDPSEKTHFFRMELKKYTSPDPAPTNCSSRNLNGFGWFSHGTPVIGDDEGPVVGPTAFKVTQNSENISFGWWLAQIDADPHTPGIQPYNFGPGQFDVILSIKRHGHGHGHEDEHGAKKTVLHVVFDVLDAPSQTP